MGMQTITNINPYIFGTKGCRTDILELYISMMTIKDLLIKATYRDSPKFKGENMECVICNSKIVPDPDGWDGGHNAEPIAKGRCCGDCNHIVTVKRLNDFQSRRKYES